MFLCLIMVFMVLSETLTHQCPLEKTYYKSDSKYEGNKTENIQILDECFHKMKLFVFVESVQNFLDHILTLTKYHKDRFQKISHTYLLVFYNKNKDIKQLQEIKEFWIRYINNDQFLRNLPELQNHVLLKQDLVNQFIENQFQSCKDVILQIKTKGSYEDMIDYYEKNDYPGLVSLCIYCYDALKYKKNTFREDVFSHIIFDTIQREKYYFGLNYTKEIKYIVHD